MHDTPHPAFAETLTPRERRLAGRLEGFGDIVFGFAISQCALLLTNAGGRVDLSRPAALAVYIGTFALLASLWLIYHRMMSSAFKPAGIDLVLAFSYLALVSLMPYAMYALTHQVASLEAARVAFAEYSALYALLTALAAAITMRNLRRGWYGFADGERDLVWLGFVRNCAVCTFMSIGLVVDLATGPVTHRSRPFDRLRATLSLSKGGLEQHAPHVAQERDEVGVEAGGEGSVDDAMIVGEGKR